MPLPDHFDIIACVAIGIVAGVQGYLSEGLGLGVVWFGIALAVLSLLRKS